LIEQRGGPTILNPLIRNQESCNQPIKQSTNQVGQHAKSMGSGPKVSPQPGEGKAQPQANPKVRELRFPPSQRRIEKTSISLLISIASAQSRSSSSLSDPFGLRNCDGDAQSFLLG
jgi:hypothetical protein